MTLSPFAFVNAINDTKQDLITSAEVERQYNSFMVNRALSYFPDTIYFANEINKLHHLDNKLQNAFMLNIVSKKKRFRKWFKTEHSEHIETIKEFYNVSSATAQQYLSLLSEQQILVMKETNEQRRRYF